MQELIAGAGLGLIIAVSVFSLLIIIAPIAIWVNTARTATALRALVALQERRFRTADDAQAIAQVEANQRANVAWKASQSSR